MFYEIMNSFIRLFWMVTPFFVLAMFINLTENMSSSQKRLVATKSTLAVFVISIIFYFVGSKMFNLLGITLDGFRIGAGIILLLTALSSVTGNPTTKSSVSEPDKNDISIVPLATPFSVGPGMMGMIMISSIENPTTNGAIIFILAMLLLAVVLWLLLISAGYLQQLLGDTLILVLGRISGLFLAALAGGMIVEGARNIWNMAKV